MFWRPGLHSYATKKDEIFFLPAKPQVTMRTEVFKWYLSNYPEDELAFQQLYDLVTFEDVYRTLLEGNDVYAVLGVQDSVIRERVFGELAKLLGKSYNDIYDLWMSGYED